MDKKDMKKVLDIAGKVIIVLVIIKMSALGFYPSDVPYMIAGLIVGTAITFLASKMSVESD